MCYYIDFPTHKEAVEFGFSIKLMGHKHGYNYEFKVHDGVPNFINEKKFNGYKIEKLTESSFLSLKEMVDCEFKENRSKS